MTFADPMTLKQRSAGMAGALIIPGALGALFVTGLAVQQISAPPKPAPLVGTNIALPPPPPPEAAKSEPVKTQLPSHVEMPRPPIDLPPREITIDTTPTLPHITGDISKIVLPPLDLGSNAVQLGRTVLASPRNDPGSWVTTDDYRTSWINRGMTGTAQFELEISTSGRVSACRITSSSGHGALDDATCNLIAKRARFSPAKDATGAVVSSSFSSSIRWQLPD